MVYVGSTWVESVAGIWVLGTLLYGVTFYTLTLKNSNATTPIGTS